MPAISSSETIPANSPSAIVRARKLSLVGFDFAKAKDVDTFLSDSFVFSIDRQTLDHLAGLLNVGHCAAILLENRMPGEVKADIALLNAGRKAMSAILHPPGI